MWREGDRRQPLKESVDREALNLAGAERCRSVRYCPLNPCQISYCMGDSRVLLITAEGGMDVLREREGKLLRM